MRKLLVIAALASIAASLAQVRPAEDFSGLLVVSLDTTRADRLTPYGYSGPAMPALERIAAEGVVFEQASAVGPLTLPAHASLFTGLLPPAHGVRDNSGSELAGDHFTLAEALKAGGFRTAAFVGAAVLDRSRGLAQGFDTYSGVAPAAEGDMALHARRADAVADEAIEWLAGAGSSKFFLWMHLYDAHRPYDPPEPYRTRFLDPYVGEIAFADAQLQRVLARLEALGRLSKTVIVVVGDHGESLGEHGERDHGVFLYQSTLRIPLIIRVPKRAPGRTQALVRITDVMPTLLDIFRIPGKAADGVSLQPVLRGTARDADLEAYAETLYPMRLGWSPLRSLRAGRYKVIDAPRPELFDLTADPFEENNIATEHPVLAARMLTRVRQLARGSIVPGGQDVPAELRERLEALGYVGTPAVTPASGESLPDPKDCLQNARAEAPALRDARCGR